MTEENKQCATEEKKTEGCCGGAEKKEERCCKTEDKKESDADSHTGGSCGCG